MIEARSASWLAPHGPLSKINRTLKTATILEDASALLVLWLLGLSSPYSVQLSYWAAAILTACIAALSLGFVADGTPSRTNASPSRRNGGWRASPSWDTMTMPTALLRLGLGEGNLTSC